MVPLIFHKICLGELYLKNTAVRENLTASATRAQSYGKENSSTARQILWVDSKPDHEDQTWLENLGYEIRNIYNEDSNFFNLNNYDWKPFIAPDIEELFPDYGRRYDIICQQH